MIVLTEDGVPPPECRFARTARAPFEDVTAAAGIERTHVPSTGAIWFDANGDGWLDVYRLVSGDFQSGFLPVRGRNVVSGSRRLGPAGDVPAWRVRDKTTVMVVSTIVAGALVMGSAPDQGRTSDRVAAKALIGTSVAKTIAATIGFGLAS